MFNSYRVPAAGGRGGRGERTRQRAARTPRRRRSHQARAHTGGCHRADLTARTRGERKAGGAVRQCRGGRRGGYRRGWVVQGTARGRVPRRVRPTTRGVHVDERG